MTVLRSAPKVQSDKTYVTISHFADFLKIEVETPRLYIRQYNDQDLENCVKLYGSTSITRYFDHGKPRTRREVLTLIRQKGKKYIERGEPFGLFSIFRKEDKAFIGQIDLIPQKEPGLVEIGFILHPKYHNQGYCTEAVKAIIYDYIDELNSKKDDFHYLPIEETFATVHPQNIASKRVLEKIGMNLEKSEDRFGSPRLWFAYHHVGSYTFA